ncbi:MAG TPA: glutamine--tRNA ligase/YqeY domain fusion protein [Planctomycetota bacterium]|nr:glutamine--tRNA ligase/YqeY domain fusion protein [Planctomycetota bacterium]
MEKYEEELKDSKKSLDFIRTIITNDLKTKKHTKIHTRFPPEPNGYLHIGHAKSICLNFGIAEEFQGICNLRMDDTNPIKEEIEYIESIKEDIRWLGFDWDDRLYYASDYFDKLYEYALQLIRLEKAYVCHLCPEEIREYRGTLTEPGKESPYRNRTVEENLAEFEKMRLGQYEEGEATLRAKIDMASPNVNMRDPVVYRILKVDHHRTGDKWKIYPMYDFAHGFSDSIEGITHSICTLEFENHRPLYDWFIEAVDAPCHPQQIEFARLNITYTVMSKRKLLTLVKENHVAGWDDPRMPTISGMRRRGYPAAAIRSFCEKIGVGKTEGIVDFALLEFCIREELNKTAPRTMAVLNPVKVIIDNYPEDKEEQLEAINNPEDPSQGTRHIPFTRELYIEQEDFMEVPEKKFFRLSPGKEVRLRYAYFIKCTHIVKDEQGNIKEIHCTYDPETKGGNAPDNRKVKATLHWVSAKYNKKAEIRIYDHLFTKEDPEEGTDDFRTNINPDSLKIIEGYLEHNIDVTPSKTYQFERLGYFTIDKDSTSDNIIINRTATLKDTYAKAMKKN